MEGLNDVKNIVGLITDEMREGDMINLTLSVRKNNLALNITHAPSWVMSVTAEEE